jgi:signal transduction histidine kinase
MKTVRSSGEITSSARGHRRAWWTWLDPGEPHPARGPFARWPHISDGLLVAVVFIGSLVAVAASTLGDGEDFTFESITDRPPGALTLLAIAAVGLLWRRRQPIVVAAGVMAVMITWAFAGYGDGNDLALVVAVYSVGRYTPEHRHSLAIVAAAISVGIFDTVIDTNQRIDIVPAIVLSWLPWYLGRQMRNREEYLALLKERADRLQADQHAEALQAVADERSRIARELHDVVAHQVSMMTVQAGAAKTVARDDLDTAIEAMVDVERAGRQALGELRHLLGVLRPDANDDSLGPQPGLAEIATLADQLESTGAHVRFTTTSLPTSMSAAVELSAYRIVQESFTNIIKHAGPSPIVHCDVHLDQDVLVIEISNTVAGTPAPGIPRSGYGISGMRERATLLDGSLTTGPHSTDSFRVVARIPIGRAQR